MKRKRALDPEAGRKMTDGNLSDLALGMLPPEQALAAMETLETDADASERFEVINALLNLAEAEGAQFFGAKALKRGSRFESMVWRAQELLAPSRVRLSVALSSSVLVVLCALYIMSGASTSPYYPLTRIEVLDLGQVRGLSDAELDRSYQAWAEGKHAEAARILERYIRAFPRSAMIDRVHYLAGVMNFLSAHRSYLSLFPSYDRGDVLRGIEHFRNAIRTTSSPRMQEESHWLRAKGFLMLEDPVRSLEELKAVQAMRGARKEQANVLASEIQNIIIRK